MSQVKIVSGRGIPLIGNDIDTDRIIPARFLRCITFEGLGTAVFADDRQQAQGQHPFDLPQYQGATILVVNANFGCGSSREHAPQAIARWGISAIVGESFAEIFLGNCVAMGLPCVTAAPRLIQDLQATLSADPQSALQVDLEAMQIQIGASRTAILMGEAARNMLVSGTWDACGQLVAHANQIQATAANLPYLSWSQWAGA